MMFLFAIPIFEAIAVLLLPQMLETRDLPFARLPAFGFWCFVLGGIFLCGSIFFNAAPRGGWFMYPPLTSAYQPDIGTGFLSFGLWVHHMFTTGLRGMPRRVFAYPANMGFDTLNLISTIGAFILAAGIAVVVWDIVRPKGEEPNSERNPGNAGTLEWLQEMPGKSWRFRSIPEIDSRYPLWDQPNFKRDVDDAEATIFYALAVLGTAYSSPPDKSYARQKKAGTILEEIFATQPNHPGVAHYIIHSFDYPGVAERALEAARRYAKVAPDAPHALHIPSHIFTRLGLWRESITSKAVPPDVFPGGSLFGAEANLYLARGLGVVHTWRT